MKNRVAMIYSVLSFVLLAACTTQSNLIKDRMTAQQKSRALAFGAVVSSVNNESLTELNEGPVDDELQRRQQLSLYKWWNIKSRNELLTTLKWIEDGGHRKTLWETREYLKLLPVENLLEEVFKDTKDKNEFNRKLMAALSIGEPQRKVPSITAWDYGRYINLCRWGYICGYLTEEEAWDMIFPVARYLQQSYTSWSEYAEDYLRGREFWSLTQMIMDGYMHRETAAKLLADRNSAWNSTSWDFFLGQEPVAQDGFLLKMKNENKPKQSNPANHHLSSR
jgi:hypothetical protein